MKYYIDKKIALESDESELFIALIEDYTSTDKISGEQNQFILDESRKALKSIRDLRAFNSELGELMKKYSNNGLDISSKDL
jgi:hypothetical protein